MVGAVVTGAVVFGAVVTGAVVTGVVVFGAVVVGVVVDLPQLIINIPLTTTMARIMRSKLLFISAVPSFLLIRILFTDFRQNKPLLLIQGRPTDFR